MHTDTDLDRLARRHTRLRLAWLTHAAVFTAVNLGLWALATLGDRAWQPRWLAGWGLALGLHGLVVLAKVSGQGLYQRLVDGERARLLGQRDPW